MNSLIVLAQAVNSVDTNSGRGLDHQPDRLAGQLPGRPSPSPTTSSTFCGIRGEAEPAL